MERGGCIYFLTNVNHTVLYLGVTSDLAVRLVQHISKENENSFSAKYNCNKLIYYEELDSIEEAIAREKIVKKWKREWKNNLIAKANPEWKDLYDEVMAW
jgi:putative endonuclease